MNNEKLIEINKLKNDIKTQKEINMELFNLIPIPSHEDPENKKAEKILKQWRNGGKKLKTLLNKLQNIELNNHVNEFNKESKTFINSFGEATKREITCNKYEKTQKSMEKEILNFIN